MPKLVYTAAKGLYQEAGSGFIVEDVAIAPSKESITAASVSAGANASGDQEVILLTLSSNVAHGVSLKDGTAEGQMKYVIVAANAHTNCVIADSSGSTLITLTGPSAGDLGAVLMWSGSAWKQIS